MNAVKSLLFLIFAAGLGAIYVPLILLKDGPRADTGVLAYLAIPLWLAGSSMVLWCFREFIFMGHGTPNPVDPPKELVVSGLYRYVRNPIYVGVILIFTGHLIWFGRLTLLAYLIIAILGLHLFVVGYEEPYLRRRFGAQYEQYIQQVPRWIPKFS
jgi:protein-S-isoprenylcysteine O-methyltransferase Ste14